MYTPKEKKGKSLTGCCWSPTPSIHLSRFYDDFDSLYFLIYRNTAGPAYYAIYNSECSRDFPSFIPFLFSIFSPEQKYSLKKLPS